MRALLFELMTGIVVTLIFVGLYVFLRWVLDRVLERFE